MNHAWCKLIERTAKMHWSKVRIAKSHRDTRVPEQLLHGFDWNASDH
jgi:hypothetical protein